MSASNLNPSAAPWGGAGSQFPNVGGGGGGGYGDNGNYAGPPVMHGQGAYGGSQGSGTGFDQGPYPRPVPNGYPQSGGGGGPLYQNSGGGGPNPNPNYNQQGRTGRAGPRIGNYRANPGAPTPNSQRSGGGMPYMQQPQQQQGMPPPPQQRPFGGRPGMNPQYNSGHVSPQPMSNVPNHMQMPPPQQQHMHQQHQIPPQHSQVQGIPPSLPQHHHHAQQQHMHHHMGAQQQQQRQQQQPREVVPPKVILVTGYRRTGKTTLAKELAKRKQYEYLSLRDLTSNAGDEDEDTPSLTDRFAPLAALLERRKTLKGIVIDDALMNNKFEPYYVSFLLLEAGLQLDLLVIITTELGDLIGRSVEFNTFEEKQAHPESFEFGQQVEDANDGSQQGTAIAVVDGTESLDKVVEEAIRQVRDLEMRGLPPLQLPTVEFVPGCELVRDPALVDEIISAERSALGVERFDFGFPYVEPNYLLDYVQFVRHALLFNSYLLVPWVWGDKVSLIGYQDKAYVHLPSYSVVFEFIAVPPELEEVMVQLKKEDSKPFLFSLEATMLDDVLYVSDMMLLGPHLGSKTLLPTRVDLMAQHLAPFKSGSALRLLEHFPVSEIGERMKDETIQAVARGMLFVNPAGMEIGNYDSRNFIYPFEDKKTVQIRLWGGRVENGMWVFDAYAREGQEECVITTEDLFIPVFVRDDDVAQYSINDGNIVECILVEDDAPQQKGRRGAKAQTTSMHFDFQKRCQWKVAPTTVYYQSAFVTRPKWNTASFLQVCSTIDYASAVAEVGEGA